MRVFTTGQAAKICKVAPRTVSKWIDSGRLPGYHIPGSLDRRVTESELRQFMSENDIPQDELDEQVTRRVLLISRNEELCQNIVQALPADATVCTEATSFGAGWGLGSGIFRVVVADISDSRSDTTFLLRGLGTYLTEKKLQHAVAVVANPDQENQAQQGGISDVFKTPFDPVLLGQHVLTLLG